MILELITTVTQSFINFPKLYILQGQKIIFYKYHEKELINELSENTIGFISNRSGVRKRNIPIITIKRKATMKATPESRDGEEGMHSSRMVEERRRIRIRCFWGGG